MSIQLFTPKAAADILSVDEETVRRYCRTKKLKYIKLGGKYIRIRFSDIQEFEKKHEAK